MRSKIFLPFLIIAVLVCSILKAQPITHPYKDMETELLQYENDYRKTIGAKPMRLSIYISNVAQKHSTDMATKKVEYGNDGFKERTDKIHAQLKPVYSFAENIACGKVTAKEILDTWLASPKHKKNIEGDYNYSGIGIAKDADSFYVTQIFVLK